MTKKMKKSEADWVRAILFALCALTWLPNWNLIRYFKDREAERKET